MEFLVSDDLSHYWDQTTEYAVGKRAEELRLAGVGRLDAVRNIMVDLVELSTTEKSNSLSQIGIVANAPDYSTKNQGTMSGAMTGAAAGAVVGGPIGAIIGGLVGGAFGRAEGSENERKKERTKEEAKQERLKNFLKPLVSAIVHRVYNEANQPS